MADPTQDPTQQDDTGADDSMSGGFTIEINVAADGSITVGVESASDESEEESGQGGGEGSGEGTSGEGADDGAQPVKNAKEAASLVLDIINNKGQMGGGDSGSDAQSGFNSVFAGQGQ